ncbi:hypothetical protein SEMRO_2577_G331780.1 [Seminavis robusta]|uniref:Uncharacterized protein n=1 Tax=Seminavis robusta TaxID=568900 RepID=A0A9N8EYZ2_9STRA|nr:hypothetical protein SEMRO_2577_G331780.1 [Seminavis robusta]|eukprot:Sro2577_g331780.1 n/a (117) ;mRNA; f:3990-4340
MLNNDETNWETHDVMLALTHFGVDTFSDLMMMERKDIESLVVPAAGTVAKHPLGFSQWRQLLAAFFAFITSVESKPNPSTSRQSVSLTSNDSASDDGIHQRKWSRGSRHELLYPPK